MSANPSLFARVQKFLTEGLWHSEPSGRSPLTWLLGLLQFSIMLGEGFVRHQLLLRASALTYVAMLSLIPVIAIALGIADAVGAGTSGRLAPLIAGQIAAGSPEAEEWILRLVGSIDFSSLGTLGSASLFLTTLLAIGNVERALNEIYGPVPQRRWARRLPDYLAVLVVSPILLGVALVMTTTLESQVLIQRLLEVGAVKTLFNVGLRQLPLLFMSAGFAFLYGFLPNTTVRRRSAILGGIVAALLFGIAQRLYLDLQVGVTRASAVFGTLSALPLLLVWIYFSCAIMLFGAEVAYANQNLKLYRREVRGRPSGSAEREEVALAITALIGRRFRDGAPPWTADTLSEALETPIRTVRELLADLTEAGIVSMRLDDESEALQLGRPADRLEVGDILRAVRGTRTRGTAVARVAPAVVALLDTVDRSEVEAAGGSLAELVDGLSGGIDPPPAGE